ncbi:helix-turn-helix domain-containing protein [Frankia gtarii]|uniref:helix-turn-helix domain-containing protein n=1 Tax=Frankia gtarii TaxID=2950102 RepID=UPI0021C1BB0D|nr:XRE family transcriptional regulator [Frankia gtarii]
MPPAQNGAVALDEARAVVKVFSPSRLALARKAAGLQKRQLADALGKSSAAVTQFELGQAKPSAETLLECSKTLGVPVSFFALGRAQLRLDTSAAHFRSLRATRAYQRDQALAFVELLWEALEKIEQVIELPPVQLPTLTAAERQAGPSPAAALLRAHWDLPSGPIFHLVRQCEAHGIVVSILPPTSLADASGQPPEHAAGVGNIDAFSATTSQRPIVVLTGVKGGILRRRFNIAHEVGHLILHRDALPGDQIQEREANTFAAEFLMPAEVMRDELPLKPDLEELMLLQKKWGVSVSALAYRARSLGVFTESQHRRVMIAISQLGWRTHEPEDTGQLGDEEPALLARAAELGSENGLSLAQMARDLSLPLALVRTLIGIRTKRPRLVIIPGGS